MKRVFFPKGPKPVPLPDIFWEHVEVIAGQCWKWHGSKTKHGYGQLKSHQKKYMAHRVSWTIHFGEIGDGLCVCHKCDNPECANPDHLFIGTYRDNSRDCVNKGRHRNGNMVGILNPRSKLSEDNVRAIRMDIRSLPKIARDYGVSPVLIGMIKRRQAWKHI